MPGRGKSTVGVVLAKILGWDFVDVDLVIQKQNGRRLQDIIQSEGNEAFLELEADAVESLDCAHTVIATGGSAVLNSLGRKSYGSWGGWVLPESPPMRRSSAGFPTWPPWVSLWPRPDPERSLRLPYPPSMSGWRIRRWMPPAIPSSRPPGPSSGRRGLRG